MNPIFYIDFYKVGHIDQYPVGTKQVWANWTPRATRIEGINSVAHVGLQRFIKRVLIEEFQTNFFRRPLPDILAEYRDVIQATLGITTPRTDHIEALHKLHYLPIEIYSIPEGHSVPLNVPSMVITNTHDSFYWLPNYLETILSANLWKPSTSATTARRYMQIFRRYASEYYGANVDYGFTAWQGHDFSFRGMSGIEDAILSGLGHLSVFSGTDTIPAILDAKQYYNASLSCGGSVPATEHSVMCATGQTDELGLFRRLITEIYPAGIVSVVSDTWDLWKVLTEYIPVLRETILARDGKVVIRPDSGDPELILCGDPSATGNVKAGVLRLLAEALGTTDGMINHAGAIYGDSITPERAERILARTVRELGLSPYNMVFGIGSYTYEYVTRDTHYFAMKATAYRNAKGEIIPMWKNPVTDDGRKKSHRGIVAVYREYRYFVVEGCTPIQLNNCSFQRVFADGRLLIETSLDTIRARMKGGLG